MKEENETKKLTVRFLALLLAALLVLSACATAPTEQPTVDSETEKEITTEPIERDTILRVATLKFNDPSFNTLTSHIESWAIAFEAKHKNVDVVVEGMAGSDRLQVELMAGKGPDVIISPTTTEWEILNWRHNVSPIPIPDVNLAMRNGIFYDISEFYDADTELNKDGFVPAVMDAGVVDGKRYVLPLRYNLLTAYVDLDQFAKTGLSTDIFEKDIIGFWNALTAHGDCYLASSAIIRSQFKKELNLIGDLIDYDKQEVLLTQEKLVEYLQAKQDFLITRGANQVSPCALLHEYYGSDAAFANANSGWMNIMSPKSMFVGGLDFSIHNAMIADTEGINLAMYPLRSTDGSVTADITFYGAVTGGSENPKLAYEFLRYFLTEQSQWEQNVRMRNNDSQLMACGWPVLVKGSAGAIHDHMLRKWGARVVQMDESLNTISDIKPYTEDDIPILNATVDKARFPTGLEGRFQSLTASTYNVHTGEQLFDLESAAAEFIEELEWHMGEG